MESENNGWSKERFSKAWWLTEKQVLAGILKISKNPLPSPKGYGKPLGIELPCPNNRVIVTTWIPPRRTALRSFLNGTPGSTIYGETGKRRLHGSRMGSVAVPFPVVGGFQRLVRSPADILTLDTDKRPVLESPVNQLHYVVYQFARWKVWRGLKQSFAKSYFHFHFPYH